VVVGYLARHRDQKPQVQALGDEAGVEWDAQPAGLSPYLIEEAADLALNRDHPAVFGGRQLKEVGGGSSPSGLLIQFADQRIQLFEIGEAGRRPRSFEGSFGELLGFPTLGNLFQQCIAGSERINAISKTRNSITQFLIGRDLEPQCPREVLFDHYDSVIAELASCEKDGNHEKEEQTTHGVRLGSLRLMDVTELTISDQREALVGGQFTARELVGAHIERAETLQPLLNAFSLIDKDQALLRAEMIDRRGIGSGALAGIPIAVKDLIDQRGLPNTAGSSFYLKKPTKTAPALRRLEEAGAIPIGRTVLHEFAFGFSSENPWTGPARNPWDTELSCGGSSGGSAAAVSARLVPAALGTDTGGSVRVPAAVCGVVGLKVTHGRIPLEGVFPLAPSLDTVGPLARSVADTELLYQLMADPPFEPSESKSLEELRVAVPHPWVDRPTDPFIADTFETFLDYLRDNGAQVEHITEPLLEPSENIIYASYPEIARAHADWFPSRHHEYGEDVQERLREALLITVAQGAQGQKWRRDLRTRMAEIFETFDVLATPTVAHARKQIGNDQVVIDGEDVFYRTAFSAFTSLVNQAGNPALSVPLAAVGAPPPSVQLIGDRWTEQLLLDLGMRMESDKIAGYQSPPL